MSWFDRLFGFEPIPRRQYKTFEPNPEAIALIKRVLEIRKNHKVTGGLGESSPEYGDLYLVSSMMPHFPKCDDFDSNRGMRGHILLHTYESAPNEQLDMFSEKDEQSFFEWKLWERETISEESITIYELDFKDLDIDLIEFHGIIMEDGMLGKYIEELRMVDLQLNNGKIPRKMKEIDPQLPLDFGDESE